MLKSSGHARAAEIVRGIWQGLQDPKSPVRGVLFSLIGSGGSRALQIACLLVVAHRFDDGDFGRISVLVLWSGILGLAVSPGFSLPLSSAIGGARVRKERVTPVILALLLATAVFATLVATLIAHSASVTPVGVDAEFFAAAFAAAASGIAVQAVGLGGLVSERAYASAMASALTLGGGLFLASLLAQSAEQAMLLIAIGASVAGVLSAALLLWTTACEDAGAERRFSGLRTTLHRVPAALIAAMVVEPTNLLVLSYIFGQSEPPISAPVIAIAQQWLSLLLFVPAALSQVMFPRWTRQVAAGDLASVRAEAVKMVTWNTAIVSAPALLLVLGATLLLSLYGLGAHLGAFLLLVAAGWISAIATPFTTILLGLGLFRVVTVGNVTWSLLFIAASIVLAQRSTIGFAEARLVAYAVFALLMGWLVIRHLRVALRD